ncbi:hypothetical protein T459_28577 [Capsicum annuum]|uniref:NB-ARC domain-containing protein n=1 Tax=Capsicum annuum TaxID=4072 RepID=A0A2G2YH92_CAPAN|nr:hypothetical protein T459_28577 [Capsicum annuum]
MAYAAVASLMSTLGLLMQSNSCLVLPGEEPTKSLHEKVEEQIQSLREKLCLLQECLENLEKNINDRKAVECYEGKIKVAAHDAEERIELALGEIYDAETEKNWRKAYKKLCKRLQQASKSIDSKSRKLREITKSSGLKTMSLLVQSFDLPEHSPQLDNNSDMVGHVNELEDMKSKITDISSNETEVVAIVAWATMSKEYCVRRMLWQLLHCIPSSKDVIREEMDDGDLAGKLKQKLWKRRYLVVIDDIWTTKAWYDISQWFPDCRGSHVLLTTSCVNVVGYVAPGKPPHHMSFLSAKQSWELLQSKVHISSELFEVGKRIADNCHGLPLTVIIVAGLLSKCNNALDGWEQVAQAVKSAIFNDPHRQCEKLRIVHFMKTGWRCLPNIPSGEGKHAIVEHLRTITGVGPSWCKKEIFALTPNLTKLEVVLDRIADDSDYFFSSSDDWDYLWPNNPAHDAFFENLRAFPPTLRRLTLCGLSLNWAAMDIVGMLPNLEALELKDNACGNSSGTRWKPSRGVFS